MFPKAFRRFIFSPVFTFLIALLLPAISSAQDWEGERDYQTSAYPPNQGGVEDYRYEDSYTFSEHNDCKRFLSNYNSFEDSTVHKNVHFKSVTLSFYSSPDSSSLHKKLRHKTIYTFNKTGGVTLVKSYDTLGKISDSTVVLYDKKGNRVRICDYVENTPLKNKMELNNDHFLIWDSQGKILLDSTISKRYEVTRWDTNQYSISRTHYKYDDSGNTVYYCTINNLDTVMHFYSFNSKNRQIQEKTYQYMKWSYQTTKYDAKENEIFRQSIDAEKDTETYNTFYDEGGRTLNWTKYLNRKLAELESFVYNPDSSYTEKEERYGDNIGPGCPDDKKTISIYNHHRDCISKIEIEESNGKIFTTTTINKYLYDKKGKMISDSTFVTGKSQWHWDKTLYVKSYKYDERSNLLESLELGGESESGNSKTVNTWNEKNNILIDEEYGSCMDKPFIITKTKYYPDGTTIKEEKTVQGGSTKTNKFGKDSRYLERSEISKFSRLQWVWKYEE